MPSDSEIVNTLKAYAQDPKLSKPVGVFCGGTSGIGLSTAIAFVKATKNSPNPASIYIVGHDKLKGESARKKLKEINPEINCKFLQHDLTYIEQAKRISNIILNHETHINLLCLSHGSFPPPTQIITKEGIDQELATTYYTRCTLLIDLAPLLTVAAESKQTAAAISVMGAGHEKVDAINPTDYGLLTSYSPNRALTMSHTYNSLVMLKLARLYPNVAFIHTFPGYVRTGISRNIPWYLRALTNGYLGLFGTDPEVAGNANVYAALISAEPGSANLLDNHLEEVYGEEVRAKGEGLFDVKLQEDLWNHTQETINKVIQLDASI